MAEMKHQAASFWTCCVNVVKKKVGEKKKLHFITSYLIVLSAH